MTRVAFLVWLLELIRQAPEPTFTRAMPETEEFESGIEVTIGGKTFRIAVEEAD